MATALPNNLECSICFESYKTPKVLSCGHSFCLKCLVRYIDGREGTFPCPICKQDVEIPQGGVDKFITNFSLQTSTDSTSHKPKYYCPNHSKKEVEYYCQTCNLGLCSKCILKDHNNHEKLDLECDSIKEKVVKELSKSEQSVKIKIEDLEKTLATLLDTSEKLKFFCDEVCTKISEKTKKIIGKLKENCEKRQKQIRNNFDKNESKLTETRQTVIDQIENIKTDLDTSRPTTTEKPTLTLIYSLTKLQDLQKLCENMKTDIPPVTYVEWREGSVNVCDILGSTVTKPLNQSSEGSGPLSTETKPLYQSSEGSGPISTETKPLYQSSEGSGLISTETKPLYQSSEGSGLISTVTKPLYQSSEGSGTISTETKPPYQSIEGSVFKFNYQDIESKYVQYYSEDNYTTRDGVVLSCNVVRKGCTGCFYINTVLLEEDNPRVKCYTIQYTVTIINKDKDKNVISETMTKKFIPSYYMGSETEIPWNKLIDPSEGFIDNEGQFLVGFDILQVLDIEYI